MRVSRRAASLAAVVGVLAVPTLSALPANASTAPLPKTVLQVKAIEWVPRTGNVEVTARVKCTGSGTFWWGATIEQRVRARNGSNVACDGDGYLSTLVLDPRKGRFHPGASDFTLEEIVTGQDSGIGSATLEKIRISPPSSGAR